MEKKVRRSGFIEGTFFATTAIIIVKLLGMLYVVPFYKIVGSQGGALYSYAYNIYLLFLEISSAGLPNAISKIISEYDTLGYANTKKRAFGLAKKILLFISIVVFLILFVFAEEIGMFIIGDIQGGNTYQDIAFVIRCVSPAVVVVPFLSITKGYLQGHKVIAPSSTSQVVEQVVRILVILTGSYLALNVFNKSLSLAVGIAVSGAFFGALAALISIQLFFRKNLILTESVKTEVHKDYSDYIEAANATGMTKENSIAVGSAITNTEGMEVSNTQGFERTLSQERTRTDSHSHTDSSGFTYTYEEGHEEEYHEGSESHWEGEISVGAEAEAKLPFIAKADVSAEVGVNFGHNWSDGWSETDTTSESYEYNFESSDTYEHSFSVTNGESISNSLEQSISSSKEHSLSKSLESSESVGSSFEKSLTKGSESSSGREQENAVAVGIGYGVDYQTENSYEHSTEVTRTFDAREDDLVKGVGWKLCDYIVKVPFYVEAIDKSSLSNTDEDPVVLYGQYVEYNLLQGVCRVFANGYIEHWYTGELVNYAEFFDGFITATELVDKAKLQQTEKVPKGV